MHNTIRFIYYHLYHVIIKYKRIGYISTYTIVKIICFLLLLHRNRVIHWLLIWRDKRVRKVLSIRKKKYQIKRNPFFLMYTSVYLYYLHSRITHRQIVSILQGSPNAAQCSNTRSHIPPLPLHRFATSRFIHEH